MRIDYNITPRHTVMGRYTHDNWQNPTPNTQGFWGDDPFPAVEANWSQPSEQIVAKITSAFGSSLVNEAAFAYSNNRINITVGGSDPQLQTQLTSAIPANLPGVDEAECDCPADGGRFGSIRRG